MKNVFIGCSSYENIDKTYFEEGKKICNALIEKDYNLVFGGCSKGLMGVCYRAFKEAGKNILGIQTEHYKNELDLIECKKRIMSSTLEQLEDFMKESDLIVYLPGGYGTLNEMFYFISEYVNETHNDKIIIVNVNHYFDGIKEMLSKIKEEKFASKFDFVYIVESEKEFKERLNEIC